MKTLTLYISNQDAPQLPKNWSQIKSSSLEHWPALTNCSRILIDLEIFKSVTASEASDLKTLKMWKAQLKELSLKCTENGQTPPKIAAVSALKSWEDAQKALLLGVHELLGAQELSTESENSEEKSNLIKLHHRSSSVRDIVSAQKSEENTASILSFPIGGLEGSSPQNKEIKELIQRCAPTESPIILLGETGCALEQIARSIHDQSQRAHEKFLRIDCKNFSEKSPQKHSPLLFEDIDLSIAQNGTLFFEDIHVLHEDYQLKLLEILQNKKRLAPSSGAKVTPNFRIISSSPEELDSYIENQSFRKELMFRLSVLEIEIPPLRERSEDFKELTQRALKSLARKHEQRVLQLNKQAYEKLKKHSWPGNLIELYSTLEAACNLCWAQNKQTILEQDLPTNLHINSLNKDEILSLKEAVKKYEKEYILKTLLKLGGSKEEAAENLGLSLATLYRKIA